MTLQYFEGKKYWIKNVFFIFLLQDLLLLIFYLNVVCKNIVCDVGPTLTLKQGCTTQISWRAKKMLLTHLRADWLSFIYFRVLYLHHKSSQMYVN